MQYALSIVHWASWRSSLWSFMWTWANVVICRSQWWSLWWSKNQVWWCFFSSHPLFNGLRDVISCRRQLELNRPLSRKWCTSMRTPLKRCREGGGEDSCCSRGPIYVDKTSYVTTAGVDCGRLHYGLWSAVVRAPVCDRKFAEMIWLTIKSPTIQHLGHYRT